MSEYPILGRMMRFANTLLLVLLVLLGTSGVVMLYGGWLPWVFDLHRIAGFALLAATPWKSIVIYRSLRRGLDKTFDRSTAVYVSLVFAGLVTLVAVLSLLWMWRLGPYSLLLQTLIAWHWIIGLLLIPFFLFHLWRRWPNPRPTDVLARRSALKLAGVAAAGLAGARLATLAAEAAAPKEQPRRFTGSRGMGAFTGNQFPLTGEAAPLLALDQWHLEVTGTVRSPLMFAYNDLLRLEPQVWTEVLDCTSGWFSVRDWQGIGLEDLLKKAGASVEMAGVRLVSATGYHHAYPMGEAKKILLATHVSGEVLNSNHGFPVRAVVPGRRGWFWVKWLVRVDVLQSPLEVAAEILASPRETLRQW